MYYYKYEIKKRTFLQTTSICLGNIYNSIFIASIITRFSMCYNYASD